jgi:hypothetical protein
LSFLARKGWQPGCVLRGAKLDPDQGAKCVFAVLDIVGKSWADLQRIFFKS